MSNNYQNNENNEYDKSVILQLESLTNEYDNVLLKYQQATANYTSFLQQTSGLTQTPFVHLKGNYYWGTGSVGSQPIYTNTNSYGCEALCSQTSGCSGATFSSNNGMNECLLRGGEGEVIPAGSNDYAIVPLSKKYLLTIDNLNQRLIDLNQEIVSVIENKGDSIYTLEKTQRAVKGRELEQNYNKLNNERNFLKKKIQGLQDLEQEEYDTDLSTNSNYLSYILLLTLVIFIILVLVKISIGSTSSSSIFSSSSGYTINGSTGSITTKAYYIAFTILLFILFNQFYKYFFNF